MTRHTLHQQLVLELVRFLCLAQMTFFEMLSLCDGLGHIDLLLAHAFRVLGHNNPQHTCASTQHLSVMSFIQYIYCKQS